MVREVLHENRLISTFDPQFLDFWVAMNIINGIARGDSPCVLAPPSLASGERTLLEKSTHKGGTCMRNECVLVEKEFKGLVL